MNVLILNWRDPKNPKAGGAEILTFEHAKKWVKKGSSVTWFTSRFPNSSDREIVEGVEIIRMGNYLSVYLLVPFFYFFSRRKFDIVVDQIHGLPFFTPLYIKEKKIVLIHEVAGEIWDYMYPFPVNKLGRLLESIYFHFYKNIMFWTCSESTVKELEEHGVKRSQCVIISSGIQNKPLSTLPKKESQPTYLFVGRIVKMKGIENVISAFYYIQQKLPDAKLWVIGTGEKRYMKQIKKMVSEKKIKRNVTFYGFISEEKKLSLMRRAHILLHASVKEGWGLVVVEAASQATPAVVYNVAGLRDSVKDGETGIILTVNTPEEMAVAASNLILDKNRYKEMQNDCLRWARKFNWENSTEKSFALISKIVKSNE